MLDLIPEAHAIQHARYLGNPSKDDADQVSRAVIRQENMLKNNALEGAAKEKITVTQTPPVGIYLSYGAIFLVMMLVFAMVFWRSSEALFMVAISGFYFAMYFGTPLIFSGIQRDKKNTNMKAFLDSSFDTWTGKISGREAWVQICMVPLAVLFAVIAIGITIAVAR